MRRFAVGSFLVFAPLAVNSQSIDSAAPDETTSSTSGNQKLTPSNNFFARLSDAYKEDWFLAQATSPAPTRRGHDAPLDSTPFPSSDYSVGGTPVVGARCR